MKRLRKDLDFQKTYGDVPVSFEDRVQAALRKTAQESQQTETPTVQRRPYLRMAIVVAALLALTATAVAAVLSRTAQMYLGPHGLGGPDSQVVVDMHNGTVSYAGQSKRLGDVLFTLDDVVWGENDLYATGTYRVVDNPNLYLVGFGTWGSHPYIPFGANWEDATMTIAEYAAANNLQLIDATISMDGYLDENGEYVSGTRSFYSYEESEGVHRFGLMLFLDPEQMQDVRNSGSRFCFTLSVYAYDETDHVADPENGDDWNVVSFISDEWVLSLPEEK